VLKRGLRSLAAAPQIDACRFPKSSGSELIPRIVQCCAPSNRNVKPTPPSPAYPELGHDSAWRFDKAANLKFTPNQKKAARIVVRTPGENSENCIDLRGRTAVVLLAHYWLPGRGVGLIKLAVP
jgi:hypothetical protein